MERAPGTAPSKTQLRHSDELLPLPGPIAALVAAGRVKDARHLIPVNAQFGKPRFRWGRRSLDDLYGVCVHHSAGQNDNPVLTATGHAMPGDRITRDGRGSPGLNYTFAITKREQPPLLCNDIEHATWSQGAWANDHLVAILVMGCFTHEHHPTESQLDRTFGLIYDLQHAFELPERGMFGHADLGKPACPGPYLMESIDLYRGAAPQLARPEDWQGALTAAGFPVEIDGVFGPFSKRALVKFRRSIGQSAKPLQQLTTEVALLKVVARAKQGAK